MFGVVVLLLLIIVVVTLRVLTIWRPPEWRMFDNMTDEILKQYVDTADDTLDNWLEKVKRRDGRSYEVSFTDEQINACCKLGLLESDKMPESLRDQFKDIHITLKPGLIIFGLKSHWYGIGTVLLAVVPRVSKAGDVSAQFEYAKLGVFRIPSRIALRKLRKLTRGTKLEGLFSGKLIDPGDLYAPFIVLKIDSIRVEDGLIRLRGHIQ
ncbi:MAG: hypothetical protein GXP25_23425 [Planctomycetes bacterium]|nr:hypothetical protein [Planctomycetota bacterium]